MKEFVAPVRTFAGRGAVSALGQLEAKRLLVVTDPYFYENGTAAAVAAAAAARQVEYFHGVKPDPTVELAAEGTAVVRRFQPDVMVALGGGSAMDCAKAMLFFSGADIRLVAIPTTSGSGSEVTDFAILTHRGIKHPLVDKRLRPWAAILDSDLLDSMPKKLIADTGFDAISHALESFVATDGGFFSRCLAKEAFCTLHALLPASYAGRGDVRLKLHQASTMAGMAFTQSGLGLCHAMSHALGGMFHVPHGRLNAILLPAVIELNAHAVGGDYAQLAFAAGIPGSARSIGVRNLKNALLRLRRELELPDTLSRAGVDLPSLRSRTGELVEAVLADPCCRTNPITVEDFMVRSVLEKVAGHG